ncbi:MAG: tetratricopeptide repeat protein [Bacteroidales bacterium]
MKKLFIVLIMTLSSLSSFAQTYEDWIEKSFVFMETQEWSAAEECILKALRMKPGNPENAILLSNLGTIQRKLGKNDEALQSYSTGLLFASKSPALLLNRAELLFELDSISGAVDDLNQLIAIDHKNMDARYLRGMIYLEKSDTTAAINDFEEMLELNPNSSKGRLGIAAVNTQRGAYQEAERLYTIVLNSNPKSANILISRAELYFLWEKYSKALEDLKKAEDSDATNPLIYFLRGKVRLKQYEKKEAAKDFQKAKELGFNASVINDYIESLK